MTSDVNSDVKQTKNSKISISCVCQVLVGAVDGGVPALTGTLTVKVLISDINDNLPVFERAVYQLTIPEDTGRDHPIVTVRATDADEGQNGQLVYSFSPLQPPTDVSYFRVDAQTGGIYLTKSLESKTGREMQLIVEARDQGHPPKSSRCKVKVSDIHLSFVKLLLYLYLYCIRLCSPKYIINKCRFRLSLVRASTLNTVGQWFELNPIVSYL